MESDNSAAGMFELSPISVIVTSSPFFLKMPSSSATAADAQSVVAVQPMLSAVCAWDAPVNAASSMAPPRTALFKPDMKFLPIFGFLLAAASNIDKTTNCIRSQDGRIS